MLKPTTKKSKSSRKKLFPRKYKMLRRVLLGLGIAIAAVTAIIATLHFLPLFIALLSVLGLFAAMAIARRLMSCNPLDPAMP